MFLIILISILFNFSYSQKLDQDIKIIAPDYNLIEKNINDKNSDLYYKKILKKYKNFDTTMTQNEMHHLYYGSVFQDNFNSYTREVKTMELNKLLNKQNHNKEELLEILDQSKKVLEKEKFNLEIFNNLLYVYDQLKDTNSFLQTQHILILLYSTLVESGDGLSCETAFHVLYIYNEYNLLLFLNFRPASQALVGNCDVLSLQENEFNINKLYYNITRFKMGMFGK